MALWDEMVYTAKRWSRTPLLAATVVCLTAVGVGAATATVSVVDALLRRPLPYPQADRIVQLWETSPERVRERSRSYADDPINARVFREYEEGTRSFAGLAWTLPYADRGTAVVGGGEGGARVVEAMAVSPDFFSVLGMPPALGRTFLDEERAPPEEMRWTPVVILSHELWTGRFASDPGILGREILFDGAPSTVVGVLPPDFRFPTIWWRGVARERDVGVYVPLHYPAFSQPRTYRQFTVVGRLAEGVEPDEAARDLNRVLQLQAEAEPERRGWRAVVTPIPELLVRSYGTTLRSLAAMVGLLVLVVTADVALLLLASGNRRRAELAIRASLGGGRRRVVRLLLTESLLLTAVGGVLGVVLAYRGVDLLRGLLWVELPGAADAALDPRVLAFALALALATGAVCGLLPALGMSEAGLAADLKGGDRTRAAPGWTRFSRGLISVQVALTLVLLVGAGLLGKSFLRLRSADRGFETEGILAAYLVRGDHHEFSRVPPGDLEARERRWRATWDLMEGLRALPGVESVASGRVPIDEVGVFPVQFEAFEGPAPAAETVRAFMQHVSPEFFDLLGIELVRGSGLPPWDGGEDWRRYWWATTCRGVEPEYCTALVSRTFAETVWPGEDPIGQRLGIYGCCWTVAGVVSDVDPRGVDAPPIYAGVDPRMRIYAPYTEMGPFLIQSRGDPAELLEPVRALVASADPRLAVRVALLEDEVADSFARPRFYSVVGGTLAVVALLLSLVGLYGVMAYSVSRRTREVGVRMALGARAEEIRRSVVGQGLRPVTVGLALGLAASFVLAGALGSLLYGMEPLDPWILAGVPPVLLVVCAAAAYAPARRASAVEPVRALSSE